jgi:hypothetical protein
VASIMTLHHLSLGLMIIKLRDALRPGGILLLLDLYRASTVTDRLVDTLAVPASKAIRLAKTGSLTERQSYESHPIAQAIFELYLRERAKDGAPVFMGCTSMQCCHLL